MFLFLNGDHRPMQIMAVVMVMVINRQPPGAVNAEQFQISGILGDVVGVARTTNMPIQAQHMIGRRHNQMQFVRDH
jgi:hypothetical protein